MKNRLIAAFLMLTAIPFFAVQATPRQLSNEGLLQRLQEHRPIIESHSAEVMRWLQRETDEAKLDTISFNFAFEVLTEILKTYDYVQEMHLHNINNSFDLICGKVDSLLDTPPFKHNVERENESEEIFNEIFTKIQNKYNENYSGNWAFKNIDIKNFSKQHCIFLKRLGSLYPTKIYLKK